MDDRSTMLDYLLWRGDQTFEMDPFNEVDNLILAQLAYVDFDGIVPETRAEAIPLTEVCEQYWQKHTKEEILDRESFVKLSPFLLKPAARSQRFGNMRLGGYVNFVSQSAEAQMSAIQYLLDDGTTYVAFRGTDDSLVGWKEDFNLSFMTRTEGQRLAVEYMVKNFGNTSLVLRVGGHSKGGNFAIYAAAFSGKNVRDQVKTVYANDAPGFQEEVTETPEYKEILAKTVYIIPEDCVIGRLLSAGKKEIVVKSFKRGIMQHDAMSWMVVRNRFAYTRRSNDSILLEKILTEWLDNVDDESRKLCVDQIFGILQSLGANNMKDVRTISIRDLVEAIQIMRSLPKEDQSDITKVLRQLVRSGGKTLNEEMEQKYGLIPDVYKKLKDIHERVNETRTARLKRSEEEEDLEEELSKADWIENALAMLREGIKIEASRAKAGKARSGGSNAARSGANGTKAGRSGSDGIESSGKKNGETEGGEADDEFGEDPQ